MTRYDLIKVSNNFKNRQDQQKHLIAERFRESIQGPIQIPISLGISWPSERMSEIGQSSHVFWSDRSYCNKLHDSLILICGLLDIKSEP